MATSDHVAVNKVANQNSNSSPSRDRTQLTSFGFLNGEDDHQDSVFAIGSILSRVRNAFVAPQETASDEAAGQVPSSTIFQANSSSAIAALQSASGQSDSAKKHSEALGSKCNPSRDHQRKSSKTFADSLAESNLDFASRSKTTTLIPTPNAFSKEPKPPSIKPAYRLPYSLTSSRQAPAITSTAAAHAVSRNRLQSSTGSDNHSIAADDGEMEDGEDDVLTSLMRRNGIDSSREFMGRYSAIPGFPLPKDILGDDTHSIHSASSRMAPRSDVNSTSEAHFTVAHSHASHSHHRKASKAGLGTSAEAFRRMRGEGAVLSKAFWMPDENVKECRECQGYFTPFRRKHHCRICGLVYCSRCASNIVSGTRFGVEGAEIRVCNFCLRMLSEYERAGLQSTSLSIDTSPQRVATSYARKRVESSGLASKPDKGTISSPLEAELTHPQAQFAANNLFAFPRSGLIKSVTRMDSLQDLLNEGDSSSRPHTPITDMMESVDTGKEEILSDEPVPFRSKLGEEDGIVKGDDEASQFSAVDNSQDDIMVAVKETEQLIAEKNAIKFPEMAGTISTDDDVASIRGSRIRDARVKKLGESINPDERKRLVSDAAIKAYRKSKLRIREGSLAEDDGKLGLAHPATTYLPSLKSMRGKRNSFTAAFLTSTFSSEELSNASLSHLRKMLIQLLQKMGIPNHHRWKETLEPLILSVARKIHPNPKIGESMNIRQYIKIKRIAGGSITDSNYTDGFVLSKQVATKKMARSLPLSNPRVMVITFSIDFHRSDSQFMSLEPLLAQEYEYTRILVARILQLRPNILVVKETVSRLALDLLEEAGVIVVWSIKMSAVQAISRCCQADVISSIDRLALEPRLGRCASFNVETFQHALSPNSRKSMMQFLTSGSAQSLGCTIILRGSNLNTLGRVKQIVSMLAFVAHNLRLEEQLNSNEGAHTTFVAETEAARNITVTRRPSCHVECDSKSSEGDILAMEIDAALKPYREILMSASASIDIPPPHALVTMKESHDKLRALQHECNCEQGKTLTSAVAHVGGEEGDETPTTEKETLTLPTLDEAMPKPSETQAMYARALLEHDVYLKEWKRSINLDQTSSIEKLSVLWALMSSATQKPCMGPLLLTWHFYGIGDESLGHFLERTCNESGTICPAKGCGRPRGVHYSSFVHNDTRVQVVQERFVCPIPGQENRLLMWSYCKQCEQATPVTPVTDDTWSFSFAKYLELHFYNVNKRTSLCGHDYYTDFIRFFSLQNLAIRFHRDRDLIIRETILPPLRLLPRPDVDYRLKVEGAKLLQSRLNAYWASVLDRIAALRKEPHLSSHQISQLDTCAQTAKQDEADLSSYLIKTCRNSDQTDIMALSVVRNRLQAAVVRWDQFFQEFEKNVLPNDRDVRRLTSHHLSRIFHEKGSTDQNSSTADRVVEELGLGPAAEVDENCALTSATSAPTSGCPSPRRIFHSTIENLDETSSPYHFPTSHKRDGEMEETEVSSATSPSLSSPSAGRQKRSNTVQDIECGTSGDTLQLKQDGIDSDGQSLTRPPLRRGKTADPESSRRRLDYSKASLGKPKLPSTGPAGPSGRRNNVPRRGPPSSYRPPKAVTNAASSGIETESDGGATSSSSIAISQHQKRKNLTTQRRGRSIAGASGARGGFSTVDDSLLHGRIRPPSRVPVPVRTNKVSTIAKRFDNLQREAEREREKHRHMMAMRARRARPLAASQATVQVYRNLKEAVRDDDEESDSPASNDEGEAEDEDEEVGNNKKSNFNRQGPRRVAMQSSDKQQKDTVSEGITPDSSLQNISCERIESSPEREKEREKATEKEQDKSNKSETSSLEPPSQFHSTSIDGTHESAAAELTVSSLLSGTLPASWRASLLSDTETTDSRGSLLKTLTSLWVRPNAHLPLIELPMSSTEHLFTDSPSVVLREDEPSSLIAFTLHSSTYASRLQSLRENQIKNDITPTNEKKSIDLSLNGINEENERTRLESDLRQPEGTHLSFQFSSGDSKFSIRVLFTEQFDALRQACHCGLTFIQSLTRCSNWIDCTGGKSGVAMMKTLDDRFVIKQLSRSEMDAFASNAGAYFRFLADVLFQDRPTTLAKIYGVYRLTIRNTHTGKYIKLDCAITENVFANAGKMSAVYDLKGALRNRFIQPNGQMNQVLQDGNLVSAKVPIFLRENAKRRLREALYHDSLFLSNCEVMDYSLVVGVSAEAGEIRVGIIDFIRTFTRSKKLESMFKEAVGGGMDDLRPTIIDPIQYRTRFLAFLDSVLLLSPDHWLSKEEAALH